MSMRCNVKSFRSCSSKGGFLPLLLLLFLFLLLSPQGTCAATSLRSSNHTSNHAVIVSSSRFWFNYRHAVNALGIYRFLRQNDVESKNIILFLADDYATNARNPMKNKIYYQQPPIDLLVQPDVRIDYRGDDVTIENLRKALLGKSGGGEDGRSRSSRSSEKNNGRVLQTDENSNVFLYWTGHGGDEFFKFQDVEEITATDIARLVEEMTFQNLLFLADTCQAFTLGNQITKNNVYMIGSSLKDENSYAHHADADLGLSVIERYTFGFLEQFKSSTNNRAKHHSGGRNKHRDISKLSLQQTMLDAFDYRTQQAHVGSKRTDGTRPWNEVPLSDFFAAPLAQRKRTHTIKPVLLDDDRKNVVAENDWTSAWKHLARA